MWKKRLDFSVLRAIWIEVILLVVASAALCMVLSAPLAFAEEAPFNDEEARLWESYLNGETIRLHVLADNDSPEAQRVKLCVRDAILAAFGIRLREAGAQNADEVYATLQANVEPMREVAQRCARQNGFDGPVTAEVGRLELPEKSYGRVTLPADEYRALRITLGNGSGKNWWCVLFPQLCLAAASEEPWQAPTPEETTTGHQQGLITDITWSAGKILEQWTVWPI